MTSNDFAVWDEDRPLTKEEIEQDRLDQIEEARLVFARRCSYIPPATAPPISTKRSNHGCMHIRRPNMTFDFYRDGARKAVFEVPLAETTIQKVQGPMIVRRGYHRSSSREGAESLPDPVVPRPEIHVTHGDQVYVLFTWDEVGQDEIYDALERGRQGIDELAEDLSRTEIKA